MVREFKGKDGEFRVTLIRQLLLFQGSSRQNRVGAASVWENQHFGLVREAPPCLRYGIFWFGDEAHEWQPLLSLRRDVGPIHQQGGLAHGL